MYQPQTAIFFENKDPNLFLGNIKEDGLFLIIEVEGQTYDQGQEILRQFKKDILDANIKNLAGFESFISEEIKKTNLPTQFSLAVGFLVEDILYLRTFGDGVVLLCRGGKAAKIISGENSASGYVGKDDLFIFTVNHFVELIGAEDEIKKIKDKEIREVVAYLKNQNKDFENQNLIALFVKIQEDYSFSKDYNRSLIVRPKSSGLKTEDNKFTSNIEGIYQNLKTQSKASGGKKFSTLIAVAIIFLILVWSVVLGYRRREEAQVKKRIDQVKQVIIQKLNQADEQSFVNLSKSLSLITEAKQEVKKLKDDIGSKRQKEIGELESLIKNKEASIVKKEEKSYEEFFDLALDDKDAKGIKMYLSGENLVILNDKKKSIYDLSLTKKALDKKSYSEIGPISLAASYLEDYFFFVKDEGIYKAASDQKPKKVIEKDGGWGEIADMWIYNGNIYLLDKGKDEIYKYLSAEDGYSTKKSYFGEGEAIDLGGANSMAIDSSVYVGFEDYIEKFTAGVRDEFKTSYPDENISLNKIFTNKNTERVYGWDKQKGVVYILEKNGTYEKQINAGILNKADDLVVFEKAIYVLSGSKIFKINL